MPTCYLHAGTHKTGTSSVQAFLAQNDRQLKQRGVLAPRSGMTKGGSHLRLIEAMLGKTVAPQFANAVNELKAELAAHPDHDVFVSAEDMEQMLGQSDEVHPVVSFFRQAGYDVKILLYFRNQPQYLNSSYAQRVRIFSYYGDFRSYLDEERKRRRFRYSTWLGDAANNKAELIARPFNKAIRNDGVVDDVLDVIGVTARTDTAPEPAPRRWWALGTAASPAAFEPVPRTNIGVGPRAVAIARDLMTELAGQGVTIKQGQRLKIRAVYDRWRENAGAEKQSYSGLDTEIVRELEDFYRADNDAFARQVWGRNWAEVFADEVGRACTPNEFVPAEASPEERMAYESARTALMSEIRTILNDPALQVDQPWHQRRAKRRNTASLLR